MSQYMLDTNICIYIIRNKSDRVIQKLKRKRVSDVGISSITLSELEYGVAKSSKPGQNALALTEFLAALVVFPYEDLAARQYGEIRAFLERKGTPIGPLDMLIAAHALALKCILVTNNETEFRRVPGLEVENWTRSPL
jgi:tRNA(fMet)-specific endonuclease VapC